METKALNDLEKFLDYEIGRASVIIECRDAVGNIKGLKKMTEDLEGSVKKASSHLEKLKSESKNEEDKIEQAKIKAADIIGAANARAETDYERAMNNINDEQAKADAKLAASNEATSAAETRRIAAEAAARDAEAKLADITAALEKQKAEMKKLIGD